MKQENKQAIAAAAVISAICSNMFLLLPLIAATAHISLGLDLEETGLLGSSFFGGYVIGSLIGLWAVPSIKWSRLVRILMPAYIVIFFITGLFANDLIFLTYSLIFAGMISGLLYNVATCLCADQDSADTAFGARLFTEQILAGLLLFSLPFFITGPNALQLIFYTLAAVYGFGLLTIKYISAGSQKSFTVVANQAAKPLSLALFKLLTFAFYFAGLSAIWAFIEILGQQWGYENGVITQLLSLGVLGGALGAFAATIQGERFGSSLPHILSGAALIVILSIFISGQASLMVSAAVVVLPGVWNYLLAYQLGQLAAFDSTGKLAPFFTPMLGLGAAIGPIAGGMIAERYEMRTLILLTIVIVAIGTAGFAFKSSARGLK